MCIRDSVWALFVPYLGQKREGIPLLGLCPQINMRIDYDNCTVCTQVRWWPRVYRPSGVFKERMMRFRKSIPLKKVTGKSGPPELFQFFLPKSLRAGPAKIRRFSLLHHNFSSLASQRDLSISLWTADQASKHAVPPLLHWRSCEDTVVPKRSRDSVSGDVSFRRPAVELLVVTMRSWVSHRKCPATSN